MERDPKTMHVFISEALTFLAKSPISGLVNETVKGNTSVVVSSIGLSVDLVVLISAIIAIPLLLIKTIIKIIQVHGQPGGISQITGWLLSTLGALIVAILVAATETPLMMVWNKLATALDKLPTMQKSAAIVQIRTVYDAVYGFANDITLTIGDAALFLVFLGVAIFGIVGGILKIVRHEDQEQFWGKAITMLITGVIALVIVAGWGNLGQSPGILTAFLRAVGSRSV